MKRNMPASSDASDRQRACVNNIREKLDCGEQTEAVRIAHSLKSVAATSGPSNYL